ncbi:MAG: alginate lyase family protein [Pyrinomonadaceae bacterium]
MLETAEIRNNARRARPRRVFCVTEKTRQSSETAGDAIRGIFTNAGLRLDPGKPVDFSQNPLPTDEEWQIEWFKFYFGLDLAHTFDLTGEERFLRTWEQLVRAFIRQVPIGFDSSDVAARRVQNWIYARQKFSHSLWFEGFSRGFEEELGRSLKGQISFIRENLTSERNHRTLELYTLFIAALALPELDPEKELLGFALKNLQQNLLTDIRPDGVHREQSTDYHLIVLRSFLGVKKNAGMFGLQLPEIFDRRLERACEFAMHIHRPDGLIPALSDGDTGDFSDLLILAAELFGRTDFLYAGTRGKSGRPPRRRNVSFEKGGYYIQRSGWGQKNKDFRSQRFLVFDCGPLGDGGHGHYDLLNLEIGAFGKPLIVDPGRYTYSEEGPVNWRRFFKGTKAHNTVCVDGLDQTAYYRGKPKGPVASGKLIERIETDNLDILSGKAFSQLYNASHTRRIFFVRGRYWVIWDRLESPDPHRYDLRFHLTPETWNHFRLETGETNRTVLTGGVALVFEKQKNPVIEPGWYSPEYGVKHRIPCVSVVEKDGASADFFTIVYPFEKRERAPEFEVFSGPKDIRLEVARKAEGTDRKEVLGWKLEGETLKDIFFETREVKR